MKRLDTIVTGEKRQLGSKKFIVGIILLFLLITSGCLIGIRSYQRNRYQEACKLADDLYNEANYRQAIPVYQRVLKFKTNSDVDLVIKLANCYIEMDQYESAAMLLQEYYSETESPKLRIQIDSTVEQLLIREYNDHVERGDRYSKKQQYAKAIQEYREAYRLMPESEEALHLVIQAYLDNSQIDQARSLYAQVQDNYDTERMEQLGNQIEEAALMQQYQLLIMEGEDSFCNESYDECFATYNEAIELMPKNLEAYEKLVSAYISIQEYEKAKKAIQEYEEKYEFKNLKKLEKYIDEEQDREVSLNAIMKELYEDLAASDMEKVTQLLYSSRYRKWIEQGTTYYYNVDEERVISQIPSSKGLVIYGSGYVYCGSFENGKRSGNGKYYGVTQDALGYFLYTGKWADDVPNGEGVLNTVMELPYNKQRHSFIVTVQGTYNNGLENGRMRRDFYEGDTYYGSMEYRCFFGIPQASNNTVSNFNWSDGYTYVIGNFISIEGVEEIYYTNTEGKWGVPGI